jgi:hypothetical protein
MSINETKLIVWPLRAVEIGYLHAMERWIGGGRVWLVPD